MMSIQELYADQQAARGELAEMMENAARQQQRRGSAGAA